MKRSWTICIIFCLTCFGICSICTINQDAKIRSLQNDLQFYTDSLHRYTKLYSASDFRKLKKENEELYKQLKDKENLVEAIEFKYRYQYQDEKRVEKEVAQNDSLYRFDVQSDTVEYSLEIWANRLSMYHLTFELTNKFTITRQQLGKDNRLEIHSQLPGKIENVTVWTKPTKKRRFVVGPSLGIGYGLTTQKPDLFVGFTITCNLW